MFEALNCSIVWHIEEGTYIQPALQSEHGKVHVATVRGKAKDVLMAERTALNILARASGVATKVRRFERSIFARCTTRDGLCGVFWRFMQARAAAEIAKAHNWHGFVAGTRKTTPGFRMVEKYSLIVGGCATHRHDLSQMVMLKGMSFVMRTAALICRMQLTTHCQTTTSGAPGASRRR